MMKILLKKLLFIFLLLGLFLTFGCTFVIPNYSTQESNTLRLKTLQDSGAKKIAVGDITKISSKISMNCRLNATAIEGGLSVEAYIRKALIAELKEANLYSKTSEKKLTGNIDYISLSTHEGLVGSPIPSFGNAKWSITITFKGSGIKSFPIPSLYLFPLMEGPFDNFCENTMKNFGPAVANLIKIMFNHPSFTEFLTS